MKLLKNSYFLMVWLVLAIVGCTIVTCCFLIPKNENPDAEEVRILGIDNVTALDREFYVNEPLSTKGAKIYLKLSGGSENFKVVDLTASNVANFSTKQVGDFVMTIYYENFYVELPYKVTYKSIGLYNPDYDFEFELNEKMDKSAYKIKCCDYYGVTVATKPFNEVTLEDFYTDEVTSGSKTYRTATVKFGELITTFNYSVFYFSSDATYVGKSGFAVDGCLYEVAKFSPAMSGGIKIVKRIAQNGLIESVFDYDLKRIDDQDHSTFFSKNVVATFAYDSNKLTLKKDAISSSQDVEVQLYKSAPSVVVDPIITNVVGVKNLKNQFVVGESVDFDDIKIELALSNNTTVWVDINKTNFACLSSDEAGNFEATINYHKFEYVFSYSVVFQSLEFYPDPYVEGSEVLEFKAGDLKKLQDLSLLCFDINGKKVACVSMTSDAVSIENFDVSTPNSIKKTAIVYCHGATLEFDYVVVA